MDRRERNVARVVRDFLDSYVLSTRIRARLESGNLDFGWVKRLVGDSEESALFRLKEECHALFRQDEGRSTTELQAGELFDLAAAALFHEGMKFRENYYLTTKYGPRLERMLADGSASGPLAEAFRRLFEGAKRRVLESESEVAKLFRETRDQLLIVLRQIPPTGAVARSLVEDPDRSAEVFGMPVGQLLREIYGRVEDGFRLAVESLIENGHFEEAVYLLSEEDVGTDDFGKAAREFSEGMASYYVGDVRAAIDALSRWISAGAKGSEEWRNIARNVLDSIASDTEDLNPDLGRHALTLSEALTQADPV